MWCVFRRIFDHPLRDWRATRGRRRRWSLLFSAAFWKRSSLILLRESISPSPTFPFPFLCDSAVVIVPPSKHTMCGCRPHPLKHLSTLLQKRLALYQGIPNANGLPFVDQTTTTCGKCGCGIKTRWRFPSWRKVATASEGADDDGKWKKTVYTQRHRVGELMREQLCGNFLNSFVECGWQGRLEHFG